MKYFFIYLELYKVMLKSHTHIGCNVSEIQNQKDEHQAFQDTAKVSDLFNFLGMAIVLGSHKDFTLHFNNFCHLTDEQISRILMFFFPFNFVIRREHSTMEFSC